MTRNCYTATSFVSCTAAAEDAMASYSFGVLRALVRRQNKYSDHLGQDSLRIPSTPEMVCEPVDLESGCVDQPSGFLHHITQLDQTPILTLPHTLHASRTT
jgi:hypothetical protein